jgi:fatty acid desaturase
MTVRPEPGRTHARTREEIAELHEFQHWPSQWMWPMLAASLALSGAAGVAVEKCWPLLLVIWLPLAAIDFVLVLAFHDASHARFHPIHWMNEAYGHLMGTIMFTPLNVYRFAHARHHAQLGRPADPELWPYNAPGMPRPFRVMSAFLEIFAGVIYTPLLFLRSVVVGPLTQKERKLVVRGYLMCIGFWIVMAIGCTGLGLWKMLAVGLLIPMLIAGMMQTLNKFEQHLGLHGQTVLGLTRTVVDRHQFGEMVSAAMLYNDYHGTHHRYAKIPYYHLPNATPYTLAHAKEDCPVFPSLASATIDMLYCLADPKVGPQWIKESGQVERVDRLHETVATTAQPVFSGEYNTERNSVVV